MGSPLAIICIARMAAFWAPLMATVATGMPGGIWSIAKAASTPSREDLMGTPITGRGVIAAMTPGRWAAIPAPAMITSMPRVWAVLAYSATSSGVRCADRAFTSKGISLLSKNLKAASITGRSDVLPIIMLTRAFIVFWDFETAKILKFSTNYTNCTN